MNEGRLDELRRTAASEGRVEGAGVVARGGPMPVVGYHGRPVLKAPPWTWEVPLYLFAGGVAGANAVLALGARIGGAPATTVTTALWISVVGVLASALLLVSDLGRPARFLNMLRVFKWRSPMSVGVWLLTAFGGAAVVALGLQGGGPVALGWAALVAAAALGALVATYTGVLLAVTVVPAWNTHAMLLPVHFGAAALGSAAALLELLGGPLPALQLIGLTAAAVETVLALWTELRSYPPRDSALRRGTSGLLVRLSGVLLGPAALVLRVLGLRAVAAAVFLIGALLSRFGWLAAGRASTQDPAAAL